MNINLISNYKKVLKNVSNIYKSLEVDFDYREYKKIAFGIKPCKTTNEIKLKYAYDALVFLIENKENELSEKFLNTFTFILFGETNLKLCSAIKNKYYTPNNFEVIEKMIDIYKFINLSSFLKEENKYVFSMLLILFIYFKEKGKLLLLNEKKLKELMKIDVNNDSHLLCFFTNLIVEQKEDDLIYYQELKLLNIQEIISIFKANKELINKEFKIKNISLFGSFTKGMERIDSDIDLLVTLEEGLSYKDKVNNIEKFKTYMLGLLKRRVDIMEFNNEAHDFLLKEINHAIKIF